MDLPQIDLVLRQTLADRRMSRGEKRVLSRIVDELHVDQQQLGVLRSRAFEIARSELVGPEARQVLDWLEEAVKAFVQKPLAEPYPDEVFFSPGEHCARKIVSLFDAAARRVDVCVFTITDDRITNAILDALGRGVKLRIVTDNDKAFDTGSDIDRLRRARVPVRVDQSQYHMHHKYAVFDGEILLTGSFNWTRSAAAVNEENFLITRNAQLVRPYAEQFDRLWEQWG
jgi:phosphatidylserine/phosphatidylglycerophosphate/cardiolipin synthase-like enzyme